MSTSKQITELKTWLGTGSINIFGYPFAGKDTQAFRLADSLDAHVIAGGDILRSYHDQKLVNKLMSTGELFPTDVYLKIVLPYLSSDHLDGSPLILSSLGRLHGEEPTIMEAAEESGHPVKVVVYLDLDEDEVWRRLDHSFKQHDRGIRKDDNIEALQTRLEEFKENTAPVISYYRERDLLVEVDGQQERDQVTADIITSLASFAKKTT